MWNAVDTGLLRHYPSMRWSHVVLIHIFVLAVGMVFISYIPFLQLSVGDTFATCWVAFATWFSCLNVFIVYCGSTSIIYVKLEYQSSLGHNRLSSVTCITISPPTKPPDKSFGASLLVFVSLMSRCPCPREAVLFSRCCPCPLSLFLWINKGMTYNTNDSEFLSIVYSTLQWSKYMSHDNFIWFSESSRLLEQWSPLFY